MLATAVGLAAASMAVDANAGSGKGGSGGGGTSGGGGGGGSTSVGGGGSSGYSGGSTSISGGSTSISGGSTSFSGGGGSTSTGGSTSGFSGGSTSISGGGDRVSGTNSISGGGSSGGGSDDDSAKSVGLGGSDSSTPHGGGGGGLRLTTGDDGINFANGNSGGFVTLGANVWNHGGGLSAAFPLGQSDNSNGRDRRGNGLSLKLPNGGGQASDGRGDGIRANISDASARSFSESAKGPWAGIVTPADSTTKSAKPLRMTAPVGGMPRTGTAPNSLRPNFGTAVMAGSGAPPPGETRFVRNEIVVALPGGMSARDVAELARTHRLDPAGKPPVAMSGTTLHALRFSDDDGRTISDVIHALEADKRVRAAQPNYLFRMNDRFKLAEVADKEAVDPDFQRQYTVAKLHLPEAHEIATGKGVLVGIIDSGVDARHPEIDGAVAETFDAVNSRAGPDPHGTATAGVIVGHDRLTGVAPAARILAAKAFVATPEGIEATSLSIVRSLNWATERGARVVNMSFAGPPDPGVARALAAARDRGVVLIAAAGNAGRKSAPLYPAADPNVIAVTATDADDRLIPEANRGEHIFAAAPGADILVPAPGGVYHLGRGTSLSAPQVAGVAALLLSIKPDLTQDNIKDILAASAHDLGPKGRDDKYGNGLIDAYQALDTVTRIPTGDQVVAVSR